MKQSTLSFLVLSVLAAVIPAHAAGVNLAWDRCYGDGPPVTNKSFACDQNTGLETVVASFILGSPVPSAGLLEVQLDIHTRSGTALPVWWDTRTITSCRRNQIVFDGLPPTPIVTCQPVITSSVPELFIIRNNFQVPTPDHMVLVASASVGTMPLAASVEYFACRVLIHHSGTIGTSACSGCMEPVAITLSQLRIGGLSPTILSTPASGNVVNWQSDVPTATRNSTWSAVKALYH